MSAKFFALLTVIGANKLAKATALGTTLKITQMAVGDGGGTLPMPSSEQTKLVNEKRRAGINTLFVDSKNANQIVAEQVIPENEGGYWIREIGLFDDEGSLIAVGNCPETYKPQLQEGSGRTQTIRMILIVSHAESVELKVDPTVVLATREFVDNAIETASKSILDTVRKEYATKEEVKKKFDNSNVVHEKGASKEKVISQKGVTDLFQPKGSYPTNTELSAELNKKVDKSSIAQQLANDVNKVPSLDLMTKELGKKQSAGNYADKSSKGSQVFSANVSVIGSITATIDGDSVGLFINKGSPFISSYINGVWTENYLPIRKGTLALEGDCYTKTEANLKFQPTGNYADKSSQNTQYFSGIIESTKAIASAVPNKAGVSLDATGGSPLLKVRYTSTGGWYHLTLPVKTGTLALEGESYTTTQSDNKYQLKGNYADKSATNVQEFSSSVNIKRELYINNTNNTVGISLNVLQDEPKIISLHKTGAWKTINIPEKSGTMALISDIEEASNIPVGSPIPWSLATAPSGYLICNGQTFNKSTYPKLGIAYPSGKLPDPRGDVIRGLDAGRGVDVGRQILSEQIGNSLLSTAIMNDPESKGFEVKIKDVGTSGTNNQGWHWLYQQTEGKNGNETRMRNIAFLYIVRAA